ncbi:MAG: hypothetical protein QM691_08210 [Opitutaceae bacterium]
MGADHRMYAAPTWHTLPDARFLDWPEHRGEDSVGAVATRVIAEAGICDGDTVLGSSLGGIVACEIANQIQLRALALIGSARSPSEIAPLLTVLHPLASLAPLELVRFSAGKLPGELSAMFAESQPSFIRAMCHAIFDWTGLNVSSVRPLRIHGRGDHVIPPPSDVDLLLDAGHLIAMTHADECVAFLQRCHPWDAPNA